MTPSLIDRWATALYKLARPYLTVLIATMFNSVCAVAWWIGDLSIIEYITAIGPTNGLIIGFWFGERAARTEGAKPTTTDTPA